MLSETFLGMALMGAEWVLYLLLFLSIISIAIIIDRVRFYREARENLETFRKDLRTAVQSKNWDRALETVQTRKQSRLVRSMDFETPMAVAMLEYQKGNEIKKDSSESLTEVALDTINQTRLRWEKNLTILATIGSNAPFVGLFGTVLGIIQAFHDLSSQSSGGANTVMAGISEALVATAVGILVAIPAVVAYNLFQRKVKSALTEAEALKSFMISQMSR